LNRSEVQLKDQGGLSLAASGIEKENERNRGGGGELKKGCIVGWWGKEPCHVDSGQLAKTRASQQRKRGGNPLERCI